MSPISSAIKLAQFGVIGLGVMGENLALNIEEHGQSVAVWNLEAEWVERFVTANAGKQIVGSPALDQFVRSLERPRRMLMMIKAGDPVDQMLERIAPLLEPGDILIDGGNSFFKDTQRREQAMRSRGLNFFGMGVSGGEEDAGGNRRQDRLRPLCDVCRRRRRGPFRQDGAQRDRIRRYAVDRRGLRPVAPRPGAPGAGDRRRLRRVEPRPAGLVSDRNQRRSPQGRRSREP